MKKSRQQTNTEILKRRSSCPGGLLLRLFLFALLFSLAFDLPSEGLEEERSQPPAPMAISISCPAELVMEAPGESLFFQVFCLFDDGSWQDVTRECDYIESDLLSCAVVNGRLLAISPGTVRVSVRYKNIERLITVEVGRSSKVRAEALRMLEKNTSVHPLRPSDREVLRRAFSMLELRWSPGDVMDGWGVAELYRPYRVYRGIPYSQCGYQQDAEKFLKALSQPQSYRPSCSPYGILQGNAGNDCSGFVSRSWALPRQTTWGFDQLIDQGFLQKLGNWENIPRPEKEALLAAYPALLPADALLCTAGGGHIALVLSNDPFHRRVYCLEQTPPSVQLSVWNYEDLAERFYKPIRKP